MLLGVREAFVGLRGFGLAVSLLAFCDLDGGLAHLILDVFDVRRAVAYLGRCSHFRGVHSLRLGSLLLESK